MIWPDQKGRKVTPLARQYFCLSVIVASSRPQGFDLWIGPRSALAARCGWKSFYNTRSPRNRREAEPTMIGNSTYELSELHNSMIMIRVHINQPGFC